MSLNLALKYLFPSIDFRADCFLQDDGNGPYIAAWLRPESQPTPEQIEGARHPAALAIVASRIKAERDRRKIAGTPVGAHVFHSDPDSRIQQIGLVMMGAALPAGIMWKTVGGAFVEMTPTLAGQIFQATAARDVALFAAAEAHIAAAAASADPLAYDFSAGWPA
jgi:hypothetical protein